jgi:hypothetical protein
MRIVSFSIYIRTDNFWQIYKHVEQSSLPYQRPRGYNIISRAVYRSAHVNLLWTQVNMIALLGDAFVEQNLYSVAAFIIW